MDNMNVKVFGLNGSREYAHRVTEYLSLPLSKNDEADFDDTEIYCRSAENVRGADVYVIHSLYGDDNDSAGEKLTKMLFFCGSLKDASAGRVTAVCPYLAFARQDRKTESRAPLSLKYIAMQMEAVGVDRMMTMDVHNLAAYQNAFRIPTDHLEAKIPLANALYSHIKSNPGFENLTVLSPDSGGMHRSRRFRDTLEKYLDNHGISLAYLDKERKGGNVTGDRIIGDIENRDVIILDDMIASGGTIHRCLDAIESHSGRVMSVVTTHGLFLGEKANTLVQRLSDMPKSNVPPMMIADTMPPFRLRSRENLEVVSTSHLFAKAIRRNHDGDSISALLEP